MGRIPFRIPTRSFGRSHSIASSLAETNNDIAIGMLFLGLLDSNSRRPCYEALSTIENATTLQTLCDFITEYPSHSGYVIPDLHNSWSQQEKLRSLFRPVMIPLFLCLLGEELSDLDIGIHLSSGAPGRRHHERAWATIRVLTCVEDGRISQTFMDLLKKHMHNLTEALYKWMLDYICKSPTPPKNEVRDCLIGLFNTSKDGVSRETVLDHFSIFDDIVAREFVHRLATGRNPFQTSAIGVIGKRRSEQDVEVLMRLLKRPLLKRHKGEPIRRAAALALGEIGSPAAVTSLVRALRNDGNQIRWAAAVALEKTASLAFEPLMRAAVHDKHWEVRDSAASALCKLRDRRSLPVLVSHFENTASEEAFRAIIAFNDDSYIPNLVQVFLQLQAQGHLSKIRYMLADYFETLSVDRLMTITSETLVKMTKFRDYKVPEDHWVEGGPDVELKETRRKAFDVLSSRGAGPDLQPTDVVTGS